MTPGRLEYALEDPDIKRSILGTYPGVYSLGVGRNEKEYVIDLQVDNPHQAFPDYLILDGERVAIRITVSSRQPQAL